METGRGSGGSGTDMGESLEILILEGVRGLGPEIGNIDTGGVRVGEGLWTDTVIGYVNIVVPGEGLEPEIRNVESWGVGDIHWGC